MLSSSVVIAVLLLLAAAVHLAIAFYFRTKMVLQVVDANAEGESGLASVVLSIRGCDPGLRNTLLGLLSQDYKNYEVHLVVDHRRDNAWELVHEIKEQYDDQGRLTIHEMTKPMKTCGLKCSCATAGPGQLASEFKISGFDRRRRCTPRELVEPVDCSVGRQENRCRYRKSVV